MNGYFSEPVLTVMSEESKLISIIDSYFIRGCFILPLGAFGVMHLISPHFFDYMVPVFLGNPTPWVYLSGLILTGTSISIFLKKGALVSSTLLVIFVLIFITTVDIPFVISHAVQAEYFIISLMKDLSLLAGSLVYFVIQVHKSKLIPWL